LIATALPPVVPGQWLVYVDGAARGNPGPAAAGICLVDPEGRPIRRIGKTLGRLPNNQAEYQALLIALDLAASHAPPSLLVRMDSELVVRQMTGRYRVKDPVLQRLHARAEAMIRTIGTVRFEHVPRSLNAEADRLANLALDGKPVDEAGPEGD
jgi:ribonuclease HI